jgi:hypothetical protein
MDTGSVGIVMPAADLPRGAAVVQTGQIEYTSSGVVWAGFWTQQQVTFSDATGKSLATANAQVFAAQTPSCTGKGPNAASCDPVKLASEPPHMMGIGFGRPDAYAFPSRNAAIHVTGVAEQSYQIDQTGLTLGVPLKALSPGCIQQQLKPNLTTGFKGDWLTPTGTLTLNGAQTPANVLLDTGINDMLVAAAGQPTSGTVATGTKLQLGMMGGTATLAYQVQATPPPGTPTSYHWIEFHGPSSFVNTGITPLAKYIYYFNSTKGIAALCPL